MFTLTFMDQPISSCRSNLMGVEGNIARIYWRSVAQSLPAEDQFDKRSRKPALDPFNAALNYMYGMLYSVIEGALFAAGLDPHLGILHADEYNKPTLSFDLIEPFRPWIDRLLIEEYLIHNLEKKFFSKNQYGLFLNKEGKAFIIPLFNDFLRKGKRYLQRETTTKNRMYQLAGKLAQRIRTFEVEGLIPDESLTEGENKEEPLDENDLTD